MAGQWESSERERGQLRAELVAERGALLAVVSGVDDEALTWPTRNPGWTVRDVLAHVLASDADLISLLKAAGRPGTRVLRMPSLDEHEREMARWADATPQMFLQHVRERGDRWRELVAALPGSASAVPVSGNWWPPSALSGSPSAVPESSGGARPLAEVVADWRGHDTQHAEDVRLALEDGRSDTSA
jgi:hypothetical protein